MTDLEHPAVTAAGRTGYGSPAGPRAICCTRCGQEVDVYDGDYDKLAVEGEDCLCKDCLEEELSGLSVWEIARALGFEIVHIGWR